MGMEFELEESDFAGYAEQGTELPAKLASLKLETKPYKDDDGQEVQKLVWKFKVVDPGEQFDEAFFYGETSTKYNTHPRNKLHSWSMAILRRELPAGFKLDTDDLLDKYCTIVLDYKEYEAKDGTKGERNRVVNVLPLGEMVVDEDPF